MNIILYVKYYQSSAGLVTEAAGNMNELDEYKIHLIETSPDLPLNLSKKDKTIDF